MNKPELLMPAGDLKTAKLAIDHGADAVYVGAEQFSARSKAKNLSLTEIEELISYAHERQAKVFCAFNILLFNDELEDGIKMINRMVSANLDAFIVQDFGIASMMISNFPETETHGSTQMAIMNLSGAKTLEAIGFDRVVLARETSLTTMQEIKRGCNIDVEVFVQGAMCVSYSGLCYMSSLSGERSGNRGTCAQPCRQRYVLVSKNDDLAEKIEFEGYLLSPKDMNLLKDLPRLMKAPVQSLKIEGRMKQPEYIAQMTNVYRRHIDEIANGGIIPTQIYQDDISDMAMVFNREGFSQSYLHGYAGKQMMSYHTPRNTGVCLGELLTINNKTARIKLDKALYTGDGIVFYDENFQSVWGAYLDKIYNENGTQIRSAQVNEIVTIPHQLTGADLHRKNIKIYKTFDKNLSKKLLKPVQTVSRPDYRKGGFHFYVKAVCGAPFEITTLLHRNDQETLDFKWVSEFNVEASSKQISCEELVHKCLNKVTSMGYETESIELEEPVYAFIPMSVINKGKAEIILHFDQILTQVEDTLKSKLPHYNQRERLEECLEVLDEIPPQIHILHQPKLSIQVRTVEQAKAALTAHPDELNIMLLESKKHDALSIEEIHELSKSVSIICTLPPIVKNLDEESSLKKKCQDLYAAGINQFMISNLGQAALLDEIGIDYYSGDYQMNVTNDLTAKALMQIGLVRQTISLELNRERIQQLSTIGNIPTEMIVYGKIPAMHTQYCAMGSFVGGRDFQHACTCPCIEKEYYLERDGKRYPMFGDQGCNIYILNDRVYDLSAHIDEICEIGLDYVRIAGTFMTPNEIKMIGLQLRDQINQHFNPTLQRHRIVSMSGIHTTTGHYLKGVR